MAWLDEISVAAPCAVRWETMTGDERSRFCGQCKLNVYNLSGMTRDEATRLVTGAEGRVCVRFLRRADGTVLTEDCPIGLAARMKRRTLAVAGWFLAFFGVGSIGGLLLLKEAPPPVARPSMGMMVMPPRPPANGTACVGSETE
jgi:hypothetical protein